MGGSIGDTEDMAAVAEAARIKTGDADDGVKVSLYV